MYTHNDKSRVEKEFTFADVLQHNVAYCDRLSVKMASENSSEDDFETLHYLIRYFTRKSRFLLSIFGKIKVNNNTTT